MFGEHICLFYSAILTVNAWFLSQLYKCEFDSSWKFFDDVAKVRFYCQGCKDGWTSMYGSVTFYYKSYPNYSYGKIYYNISKQQCEKCPRKEFIEPLWYPEEAQKVSLF